MKKVLYIVSTMVLIATTLSSCVKDIDFSDDSDYVDKEVEIIEIDGTDAAHGYDFAPGTDPSYVPADKTTYAVISYGSIATIYSSSGYGTSDYYDVSARSFIPSDMGWAYYSTGAFLYYPTSIEQASSDYPYYYYSNYGGRSLGYYAYIADPRYNGILQPCDVNTNYDDDSYNDPIGEYAFVRRNPQKGQGLPDIYTYHNWRTVFIHPAVSFSDLTSSSYPLANIKGKQRILLSRQQKITVSESFAMNVRGYGIFILPDTVGQLGNINERRINMHDIRSKILIDVKRDAELTSDFVFTNLRLRNAGYWGWFHPLYKYTDISYYDKDVSPGNVDDLGYPRGKEWVYVGKYWALNSYNTGASNNNHKYVAHINDFSEEPLLFDSGDETDPTAWNNHDGTTHVRDMYVTTEAREAGNMYYTTGDFAEDGIYVFPNDYRTGNYLTPSLLLTLKMGDGIRLPEDQQNSTNVSTFEVNIPLTMHFKPGYQYKFNIVVSSTAVRVTFQEKPWNHIDWDDPYLGIDPPDVLSGIWEVVPWDTNNGGDGNGGDINIGLVRRR